MQLNDTCHTSLRCQYVRTYPACPGRGRRALTPVAAAKVVKLDTGAWAVVPLYRAKGIVHFLGGAFAGAAPQVVYSQLLDSIAAAGYTAVSTPYAVTFRHDECARSVRQQFLTSLDELRAGAHKEAAPPDVPCFGLGHSNGALLHLLIGVYNSTGAGPATDSNILLSFNNKQVKDAIPVPGLMESLPAALRAARAAAPTLPDLSNLPLPLSLSPGQLPISGSQVLSGIASLLPRELGLDAAGQLSGAGLLLDQIPAVFNEAAGGATDFFPSPAESRSLIAQHYRTSPTLVVRFRDDSIDESTELTALLKPRLGAGVTLLTLPGSHLTPCGGDLPTWLPGSVFGPADVLVQAVRQQQGADTSRLQRQVLGWMDAVATR